MSQNRIREPDRTLFPQPYKVGPALSLRGYGRTAAASKQAQNDCKMLAADLQPKASKTVRLISNHAICRMTEVSEPTGFSKNCEMGRRRWHRRKPHRLLAALPIP